MAESDSNSDSAADEEAWEAVYQLRLQRRPVCSTLNFICHSLLTLSCPDEQLILKAYAPRCPMEQLADEFRVTKSNPNPPLLHYGIPLESSDLPEYAERHGREPARFMREVSILSEKVRYPLGLCVPFGPTTDCRFVLELYSNYTMRGNQLKVERDEQEVISMLKEELKLDPSVRPKWYFDHLDPWRPSVRDQLLLERAARS